MKKLVITAGIIGAVLLLMLYNVKPASGHSRETGAAAPGWEIIIGSLFTLSWLAFILSATACKFHIDPKKLANDEDSISLNYYIPSRKHLKDSGHVFATIRQYSLIASAALLVVVLAIAP